MGVVETQGFSDRFLVHVVGFKNTCHEGMLSKNVGCPGCGCCGSTSILNMRKDQQSGERTGGIDKKQIQTVFLEFSRIRCGDT